MRVQLAIPDEHVSPDVIEPLLEAGARLNMQLIRAGQAPTFSEALAQGIRWQPEPPGLERFDHAAAVAGRGHGDCDDLGPMRVAELRLQGERGARSRILRTGPNTWHAYVERADGSWEDPSEQAGMIVPAGGIRPPCCRAIDPRPLPAVRTQRMASVGGYRARAELPWIGGPYKLACEAIEGEELEALSTAIAGACLMGQAAGLALPQHMAQLVSIEHDLRARHGGW